MTYEEIFKHNYSPAIKKFLTDQTTSINNKDYSNPKDAFCELYENIVNEILKYAMQQLNAYAKELCQAKEEVIKKITNTIGRLPEKIIYKNDSNLLKAYHSAFTIPTLVESIYFDILEDVLSEENYYSRHTIRNAEEALKKHVYLLLESDIPYYASDFKRYLNTYYSEHMKIKANDDREQRRKTGQLINNIENINNNLKQQIQNIDKDQIKYNDIFKELNKKEALLTSLLDFKATESIPPEKKSSIESKIQILQNEIESTKNQLSQQYINCQQNIATYNDSQKDKATKIKEFKKIYNLFITRLEAIDNFYKNQLQGIAVDEIKHIIDKNIDKIRIIEIDKYHKKYSNKLLKMYYYILYKHLLKIKSLLKVHTKLNNYKDILLINDEAKRILVLLSKEDKMIEEYSDVSEIILKVVIYDIFIKDITPDWSEKFSFWEDYKEFIKTCKQYSPIKIPEEAPNGFFSFTQFKGRDKCDSQLEFTTQFNDYKEKFSSYEAQLLAHNIISTGITKSDQTDFVVPVAKTISFNEFRGTGSATFIQLSNSTWFVVSTLGMAFRIKKYTNEEIMAYPAMQDILLNYETTFLQSYITYFTGGREIPNDSYISTNTYYYPEVLITRLGNDQYGNKKVTNYQSYLKFWEDFYDGNKEIVKDSLFYDKTINNVIDFSEKNLFSAITKSFHSALQQYADYSKQYMDRNTWYHIMAKVLIPFYDVLYKKFTDDSYELTTSDFASLIIDGLAVTITLGAAGIIIAENIIKSVLLSMHKAEKIGIKGGKNLLIYAARNATDLSHNITTALFRAAFNLINPIPFFSFPNKFPSIIKSFKKALETSSLHVGENYKHLSNLGELNPEWSVKGRVIDLPANKKRYDGYYKNVYELSPESSYSLADKDYYIKSGSEVYQVEWDDYCHTWRIIDQRGINGYKTPVKWGNFANKWVTHSAVPGLGGSPVATKNFIEITEEEARPIVEIIEEGRIEALNRITKVKNAILSNREEYKQGIIDSFFIFLGFYDKDIVHKFTVFLNREEEVLNSLSTEVDIVYYGGFDDISARAVFTTNIFSYYNEKKLNKPFLNAYVNPLIDINDTFKFTKEQFRQYISTTLIHEIHHAIRKHSDDLAYEAILEDEIGNNQIDVSNLIELTVPHLRFDKESMLKDDGYILERYYNLNKNIEILVENKQNPKANKDAINQQLRDVFDSMIKKSDRTIFTNPDNVAFLVNLIYDLVEDRAKFNAFVASYDAWLADPQNGLIWNYKHSDSNEMIPLNLENPKLGQINRGVLKPIIRTNNIYYVNNAYPIETKVSYIISDISNSNITHTEIGSSDFLKNEILTTCKGNDIKTQNIIDDLKTFEKNIFQDKPALLNNTNFINISNNKDKVIGLKIKKSDIIYGYPVLIYNQYKGIFTLVCANKGDSFYIFYCNRPLNESIPSLLKVSNEIYTGDIQTFKAISTPFIDNFLIHLGNRYEKVVIHYSDIDINSSDKSKLTELALPNTTSHQYDKIVDTNNDSIALGQSYVLLTKTMDSKPKAKSASYSTLIRKEDEKLIFNNVSDYSISYEF